MRSTWYLSKKQSQVGLSLCKLGTHDPWKVAQHD